MPEFLSRDGRFMGLEDQQADPEGARCVILPVPFERTATYKNGADKGPDAILEASLQVELFDAQLGFEPYTACDGIITQMPMNTRLVQGRDLAAQLYRVVSDYIESRKTVITLGGEHTSIVGSIQAHAEQHTDLTVLQLDAHSDLRPEYQGKPWSHAAAMARVLDFHDRLVQVGIRSQDKQEREFSESSNIPVFYGENMQQDDHAGHDWIAPIVEALSSKVYITLDCDVFDPALIPATGTPEPGGLNWRQMNDLLSAIFAQREVVGFDINELSPIAGLHHPQFVLAKLIYRMIGMMFQPSK